MRSETTDLPEFADRIVSRPPLLKGPSIKRPRPEDEPAPIALISQCTLFAECLAQQIKEALDKEVTIFPTVNVWLDGADERMTCLVVFDTTGLTEEHEKEELDLLLVASESLAPIVVAGECEAPDHIASILTRGAKGYIPTSLSLDVAVKALSLVCAGVVYIPASTMMTFNKTSDQRSSSAPEQFPMFTPKQAAVIEAIRQGNSNSAIAHKLDMCESTVKVHVRSIMKKLNARNRTQVAFMASQFLDTNRLK